MPRLLLASVLAAIAMFVWGFLFWGISPLPGSVMKPVEQVPEVQAALKRSFPESGAYFVPPPPGDPEQTAAWHEAGPLAMVHIRREGAPMMDPGVMFWGFVHGWVVCLLLGWLLGSAAPALPGYVSRVAFLTVAGFAAALFIDYGSIIWWYSDRSWQLLDLSYHTGAWLVAGLVLAAFPPRTGASGRTG